MIKAGNPLFESQTTIDTGVCKLHQPEIHLEDMSAKSMKKLEHVFRLAEQREGPLSYETFRNVLQGVIGQKVMEERWMNILNA